MPTGWKQCQAPKGERPKEKSTNKSLEFEYESPYLQSIMTVNKERFNILILKEDKERWIKAFNGTKEQTNEK